MTKKFIALFAGLMTISVLSSCTSGTITSTETETKPGTYEVFYTADDSDYLNFLNSFDEEKYEIIDISKGTSRWYVTYKIKE